MMLRFLIVLSVLLAATSVHADQAKPKKSPVGQKVANFALKDYRGKEHSLNNFKDSPLLVIAFLGTECPLAKLYGPRLVQLQAAYRSQGVAFLGINSNSHDSITEIAAHARIHKIEFPVLKDLGNKIADRMGAIRTPEVFVLDKQRVVRYWGRIDDQYGVGYLRDKPKRQDLRIALDELLAGKPVSQPQTKADGCFIGRVRKANPKSLVNYTQHIAPLLQKRCVKCHRQGDIAPFALTKYKEVAGWADMIEEVVSNRRMPPWHADPKYGHFTNDRSLTKRERKLIRTWVRNGAPHGPGNTAVVKSRASVIGWQLPQKPDAVFFIRDEPYVVPAEGEFTRSGERRGIRYKYFVVDPKFQEDKWIRMAEVVPGNRAVVHHILVGVRPPSGKRVIGAGGGEFLVGYVPGLRGRVLKPGMAKFVPAGSKLIFQVHYTPNGSVQKDRSKVGFVFANPKDVKQVVYTTKAINHRFRIPPQSDNYRVQASSGTLPVDVKLISLMPHMHLRGKSFSYTAVYPDGKREVLLNVPAYDFNWQTSYILQKPKNLPAGTRIECVAHYDNSADNLANPDPNRTVRWGDQTWHEMMIGYFDIVFSAEKFKRFRK